MKALQAISLSVVSSVRLRSQGIRTFTIFALLICLLAMPATAVTGSLMIGGINLPVGILWIGSSETQSGILHGHVWVADATSFCRYDPDGKGGLKTSSTCAPGLPGAPSGQPDWDPATNTVYIPTAAGIARYTFNPSLTDPTKETLSGPTGNLGQPGVLAVAFGPDKKLYFGGLKDSLVHRLTTPNGASQTVQDVGVTAGTHPGATQGQSVFMLAFQGSDLYIDTKAFLQRIPAASVLCNGGCAAEDLNINIAALGSNRSSTVYFAATGTSLPPTALSDLIDQYDAPTRTTAQLSGSGTSAAGPIFYAAVRGFTVNAQTKAIYVLDDQNILGVDVLTPTPNAGRVILLPSTITSAKPVTSVAPATDGPAPFLAPVPPSVAPALPGRSATIVGNIGSLTAPGMLVINGDIWALDQAAGVCKANNGSLDFSTCVAVKQPGQSSFDATNNLVYVPDSSPNSVGVWRFTYDPSKRIINPLSGQLVAANKGLGGNQPQCASLGPDGSLYVSFVKNGSVLQITAPNTTTNTVTQVAQSGDGKGIKSLAWITRNVIDGFGNHLTFNDLYMLESGALSYSTSAITGTKAKGNIVVPAQIVNPMMMVSDGQDTMFIADGGQIMQYIASTQVETLWALGSSGSPITPFGAITGLSLDPAQQLLWIGDDASGAALPGQGREWQVASK